MFRLTIITILLKICHILIYFYFDCDNVWNSSGIISNMCKYKHKNQNEISLLHCWGLPYRKDDKCANSVSFVSP